MSAGEAECGRDVLAWSFFEQPHHHHGALGIAESIHAAAETDAFLGLGNQCLCGRPVGARLDRIDRMVRACEMMTTSHVSRGVDQDAHEERYARAFGVGEMPPEGDLQERAEGVMHAVESVFRTEALPSSTADELGALFADDEVESV